MYVVKVPRAAILLFSLPRGDGTDECIGRNDQWSHCFSHRKPHRCTKGKIYTKDSDFFYVCVKITQNFMGLIQETQNFSEDEDF